MQNLTLRGIALRRAISDLPHRPRVIESYPGAAQDILSIPRKQKGLDLLREGLRRLGLRCKGLETRSHDEMDAITSAVVVCLRAIAIKRTPGYPRLLLRFRDRAVRAKEVR